MDESQKTEKKKPVCRSIPAPRSALRYIERQTKEEFGYYWIVVDKETGNLVPQYKPSF
jgi:hypothetical protein